ncbi:rhodanese-like domain-containing protein, partial [Arthrospira platensis SPKY1]|nr:rhodanese-like domain-containing protein [Arthrospira platensis SPKY1]
TTFPTLNTSETTGEAILEARVKNMLTNTAWTVTKTDVLASPSNYFVNNYWSQEHYDLFGHITGAYRIFEDLKLDGVKYLDPSKAIVTYCYTGQTSAITSAWLEVLGYDAKSLMFGANGIVHSQLLVGAPKVTWGGDGSGFNLNFGYYDKDGNLHDKL